MSKINELVQEVVAESNHTLVRSQRIAIANAIAKGIHALANDGPSILPESDAIIAGDNSAIE